MPNSTVVLWARENARMSVADACKRLGIKDSGKARPATGGRVVK